MDIAVRSTPARQPLLSPASDDELVKGVASASWTPEIALNFNILRKISSTRKSAVVVATRNDGVSIIEWVAHYRALGFDAIFVYSNDNMDESDALLAALHAAGAITYIRNITSIQSSPQVKAFEHSLHKLIELRDYEWVYYADSDEFLDLGDKTINEFISNLEEIFYKQKPSAICLKWQWYTSNFIFRKEQKLLLRRFQFATSHNLFKSIVRLSQVASMRILHFPILFNPGFFVDQNFEPITSVTVNTDEGWLYRDRQGDVSNGYIRHYWCKSFEEFAIKKIRGDALGLEDNFYRRNFSDFFAWNASDSAAMHKPPSDWLVERVDREYQFLLEIPGIRSLQETLERDFERLFDPIGGPEKLRLIYDRFLAERQPVRRPDG